MKPYEFIEGYEQVIARFGQWPSFHDGEVLRVVLDRLNRSASGANIPTAELHIRGWIMGPEVTDEGFFKLHNDSVVRLLFEDIFDFDLEGFNQQNVLSSLVLTLIEDPNGSQALHVELEHCYLFSGEFSTRRAKVLGVTPYVEPSDG